MQTLVTVNLRDHTSALATPSPYADAEQHSPNLAIHFVHCVRKAKMGIHT